MDKAAKQMTEIRMRRVYAEMLERDHADLSDADVEVMYAISKHPAIQSELKKTFNKEEKSA